MTITKKCDLRDCNGMSVRFEDSTDTRSMWTKMFAKNGESIPGWAMFSWTDINELHDFLGEWLETHSK